MDIGKNGRTFNRTSMESKLNKQANSRRDVRPFNRTSMESKRSTGCVTCRSPC